MAGTINYSYDPGQVVWVIADSECADNVSSVREGTVYSIRCVVLNSAVVNTAEYNIILVNEKSTKYFSEEDTFGDLQTAIIEYQTRIQEQ